MGATIDLPPFLSTHFTIFTNMILLVNECNTSNHLVCDFIQEYLLYNLVPHQLHLHSHIHQQLTVIWCNLHLIYTLPH